MTLTEFNHILEHPNNIIQSDLEKLGQITTEYPYFQTAKILYLKALQNQNSFKFNSYLKNTAAYTTDRTVLFDFISVKKKELSNNRAKKLETSEQNSITDNQLEIGQPLVFDQHEKHSFDEWLQLNTIKPINRKLEKTAKFELIDKFIQGKPKIKPLKDNEAKPALIHQIQENNDIMTETLAKVYLEQKKYKKAITAYKILSLKYPEKSGFFADRIKAIKKLQNNN